MIDYIKLGIVGVNHEDLIKAASSNIDFQGGYNPDSGEVYDFPIIGYLYKLKITIKGQNYTEISGSLHKYYESVHTGKNENWNQYTLSKLAWTVARLNQIFDRNIKESEIRSFEFGVNLNVDFDPKKIIERYIVNYNGGMKSEINTYGDTGYFCEFRRRQYSIKIYDKGKQYKKQDKILRFEYKTKKMEPINKEGIRTLGDLLCPKKLNSLKNILLRKFDGLLIVDRYSVNDEIKVRDRHFIEKGLEPFYWEDLKPKKEQYKCGSTDPLYIKKKDRYQAQVKKYKKIIDKYGFNKYSKKIRRYIIETWDHCANNNNIAYHEMTLMNPNELQGILPPNDLLYNGSISGRNLKANNSNEKRVCPITGIDISHQDPNSKYLSKASIKEIFNNDKKKYRNLERQYGKKSKVGTIEQRIDYITRTIHNKESEKRYKLNKRIKKINSGLTIFDNKPLIELTSNQQYLLKEGNSKV